MIKAKLLYSKPNKAGETVLYLGKGINRLEIVAMEGDEIVIDRAEGKTITPEDDFTKLFHSMITDFGDRRCEEGKEQERAKWQQPEPKEVCDNYDNVH